MVSHVLKTTFITLLCLVFARVSAQEICNNGFDDDGNGLVDLKDPACVCWDTASSWVSYIPNPSFEAFEACPTWLSQMDAASLWIQPTIGTSDYNNSCGYVAPAATARGISASDGNGFAGGFYLARAKEYIGTRLTQPLLPEEVYTLGLDVAMTTADEWIEPCTFGQPSPVRVSVFGSKSGIMPLPFTSGCPTLQESDGPQDGSADWFWLGDVEYTPDSVWQTVSVSFRPVDTVYRIMIGPPCDLPPDYPNLWDSPPCIPYMLYDRLSLRKVYSFQKQTVAPEIQLSQTSGCSGTDYLLSVDPVPGVLYYWSGPGFSLLVDVKVALENVGTEATGTYGLYYTMGKCTSETAEIYLAPEPVPEPAAELPNIITPNGDGVNDELNGDDFTDPCGDSLYELLVWNRWGNEIFKQTKGGEPFRGKNNLGNTLPQGVYFYSIRLEGQYHKQTLTLSY